MFTPLEQFDIIPLFFNISQYTNFKGLQSFIFYNDSLFSFYYLFSSDLSFLIFYYDFSLFNNFFLCIFLIYSFIFLGLYFNQFFYFQLTFILVIFFRIYNFCKYLIIENIGALFLKLTYILFYLFSFLCIFNLFGMIPYCFTITSHLIVTFVLAFSFFYGIHLVGILLHGFKFLRLFLPEGSPFFIIPFLVIIELVSYLARVFSLSIRLFANMMAGHTLLIILASFFWFLVAVGGFLSFFSIFPYLIIFSVLILEFSIAILQAYVFSVLICIYLSDVIKLH